MRQILRSFILVLLVAVAPAPAQENVQETVPAEWRTPAEVAGFEATPSYADTLAFLERIQKRLPEMRLDFYGRSGQGRRMPVVVVSKEKAFTPEAAARTGKPVLMFLNGIHSGEIDGKDACLMILRDLALGRRRELLDAATLVIVPIYNIDGHERVSPYNRPNQNGPRAGMGFRTNAIGLDLNRDFLKVASPEAQALIGLISAWRPHLHVDNHVTDGVDHDWVLTWSYPEAPQIAAPVDAWVRAHLPAALAATERAGHRHGPYVDLVDRNDPSKGFSSWVGQPRYSSGYFPLRNRPSVLVEMHSYKPYRQRVIANRDFLLALLAEVGRNPGSLVRAVTEAEAATVAKGKPDAAPSEVVVSFKQSETADRIPFPVYAGETKTSVVTGAPLYLFRRGEVAEVQAPWFHRPEVAQSLPRPRGYLVLPGWPQIEQRLRVHGLRVEEVTRPAELDVETIRVSAPDFGDASYQGLTA
ncbi:MAG TPA: M14 family metallopeptidase, partial [Thermoanaerobaculia bacterium]|nr:M14 family metallopeptidase [Thermoanaerobaculia bacterium]